MPVDYYMIRAENEIQCELLKGPWSNSEKKFRQRDAASVLKLVFVPLG